MGNDDDLSRKESLKPYKNDSDNKQNSKKRNIIQKENIIKKEIKSRTDR